MLSLFAQLFFVCSFVCSSLCLSICLNFVVVFRELVVHSVKLQQRKPTQIVKQSLVSNLTLLLRWLHLPFNLAILKHSRNLFLTPFCVFVVVFDCQLDLLRSAARLHKWIMLSFRVCMAIKSVKFVWNGIWEQDLNIGYRTRI